MSCRNYQRLLNLNRPGELNAREQEELDAHLAVCSRCAEEWRRIQAIESRMKLLRQEVHVVTDPQGVMVRILDGIQARPRPTVPPMIETITATLSRLFEPALPRRAAAIVCLGMICVFLGQHLFMLSEVRGLEQKVTRAPHARAGFDTNYIISAELWQELERDLGNGTARQVLARFVQRKGDRVYLIQRPLKRLTVKYRDRQIQRAVVMTKLLEKNPGVKEKIEPFLKGKAPGFRPWFKLEQQRRKRR